MLFNSRIILFILPNRTFLFLILMLSFTDITYSNAMPLTEYLASTNDPHVAVVENGIYFYGAHIHMKDPEVPFYAATEPEECVIIDYKGKNILSYNISDDYRWLINVDKPEDFYKEVAIAKNFPEDGMTTLSFLVADQGERLLRRIISLTTHKGKLSVFTYWLINIHPLNTILMNDSEKLLANYNPVRNVYLGDVCPEITLGCTGCTVNATHYLTYADGTWRATNPGEFKKIYLECYNKELSWLREIAQKEGLTLEQFSKKEFNSYMYSMIRLVYYSFMEGMSVQQCANRMKEFNIPKKCFKKLLNEVKNEVASYKCVRTETKIY